MKRASPIDEPRVRPPTPAERDIELGIPELSIPVIKPRPDRGFSFADAALSALALAALQCKAITV